MNAFVICNKKKQENRYLKEISKEKIAKISEEMWKIRDCQTKGELDAFWEECRHLDVAYLDVTEPEGLDSAEQIRQADRETAMLVIADVGTSPMEYLKPSISPNSLLLRPLQKKNVEDVVADIWDWYQESHIDENNTFAILTEGERLRIPYHRILYLESYQKKIALHLEGEKYDFTGTIAGLEERLPSYFVRIHRSYIINKKKLQKILLADGKVKLCGNITLPFARAYKPMLKEWRKKGISYEKNG